jgi:DNA-binding NtrC family response regulator
MVSGVDGRILVIDDEESTCELLETVLGQAGFDVRSETEAELALRRIADEDFDAVLTDLQMPGMDGIDLSRRLAEHRPDLPVIVVTGHGSMDTAVAAMRAGAYDFVTKPIDMKLLTLATSRAVERHRMRRELLRLRREVEDARAPSGMLGRSKAMRDVFNLVARVADSDATVLVTGESGTGKELVARSVHSQSERKDGPFVAINCAAVPNELLESELFGHKRGSFTGATHDRRGLFVEANRGTLFLDEVGELPLETQPKLLRALQERKVRPVGGTDEIDFDVRIVAATNRDLETDVESGRFREDLYYRVDVVRIDVPPLRARGSDVLLLAQHFVERFARTSGRPLKGVSAPAAERLMAYDWPGNVRELENCMERAVALARFDEITVEDLPKRVREHRENRVVVSVEDPDELLTLDELERRYIRRVLELVGGNKSQAARVLGLDRRTLYRRLEKYETE